MKAIRNEYAERGVTAFYEAHADIYENPHFPYIAALLKQNESKIDYSKVLDFCGGGGEVTIALSKMGYENCVGCDPFTTALFVKNTHKYCFSYSFDNIIKGNFTFQEVGIEAEAKNLESITPSVFSAIICSFAMHLCPEKMLQPLVAQLFLWSKNIVIITPHKRPELEKIQGVKILFEDFVFTARGKKVFLKSYQWQY